MTTSDKLRSDRFRPTTRLAQPPDFDFYQRLYFENMWDYQSARPDDDAIFLKQLYLANRFQRQQIGSGVMKALIEEPGRMRSPWEW